MSESEGDDVGALAEVLTSAGLSLAVAESLTGGSLSARLAAGEGASEWYRGAIVSYSSSVKHHLLGVPDGPVVSEASARCMAEAACRLLEADLSMSVTGAGGPDPQDGRPPGTVWMALHDHSLGSTETREEHFSGSPAEVVDRTCDFAIRWMLERCRRGTLDGST
jgi:nicotinamide-nucleotide amidase